MKQQNKVSSKQLGIKEGNTHTPWHLGRIQESWSPVPIPLLPATKGVKVAH